MINNTDVTTYRSRAEEKLFSPLLVIARRGVPVRGLLRRLVGSETLEGGFGGESAYATLAPFEP